jgi:hypothetical protein
MKITTESLSIDEVAAQRANRQRAGTPAHRMRTTAFCHIITMLALAGCGPSTEVIDLANAPQATRDAMSQVTILPVGMPAPPGVGSIGPISGAGCGPSSQAARDEALRQLQVKAMRIHATAVVNVLIGPADSGFCLGGYNLMANGVAVAPRGISPAY